MARRTGRRRHLGRSPRRRPHDERIGRHAVRDGERGAARVPPLGFRVAPRCPVVPDQQQPRAHACRLRPARRLRHVVHACGRGRSRPLRAVDRRRRRARRRDGGDRASCAGARRPAPSSVSMSPTVAAHAGSTADGWHAASDEGSRAPGSTSAWCCTRSNGCLPAAPCRWPRSWRSRRQPRPRGTCSSGHDARPRRSPTARSGSGRPGRGCLRHRRDRVIASGWRRRALSVLVPVPLPSHFRHARVTTAPLASGPVPPPGRGVGGGSEEQHRCSRGLRRSARARLPHRRERLRE